MGYFKEKGFDVACCPWMNFNTMKPMADYVANIGGFGFVETTDHLDAGHLEYQIPPSWCIDNTHSSRSRTALAGNCWRTGVAGASGTDIRPTVQSAGRIPSSGRTGASSGWNCPAAMCA